MITQETIEKPISQREMLAFLNITSPAILSLRRKGKIPFMQVGSRIMYQPSKVIEALTKKNDIPCLR